MIEQVSSSERDLRDLEQREREWRDLEQRRRDREREARAEQKATLLDHVRFAARLRRNHNIPLTSLIRESHLSLDQAVRAEDGDWISEDHALELIRLITAKLKPIAEEARKRRAPRQSGTELAC